MLRKLLGFGSLGLQLGYPFPNLRHDGHSGFFAFDNGVGTLTEVGSTNIQHLGANDDVGAGQLGLTQLLPHDGNGLAQRAQHAVWRLASGLVGDVHGNHHISAQLARGIYRHRAGNAAIHKVKLANSDWLEYAGHAAGGAYRLTGIAAREHGSLTILKPRGDRHKRLGQLLQWLAVHLFVDIVFQLLAQHQTTRRQLQIADLGLVQRYRVFLQLKRVHATGIECAHHAAGAGASHDRGREAIGFQHLDHADVGKAFGRATAQSDTDLDRRGAGRRGLHWGGYRGRWGGRIAVAGGKACHTQIRQGTQKDCQTHSQNTAVIRGAKYSEGMQFRLPAVLFATNPSLA